MIKNEDLATFHTEPPIKYVYFLPLHPPYIVKLKVFVSLLLLWYLYHYYL